MNPTLRRPEEILAYRSLQQILGSAPWSVWAVGPADSLLTALRVMADKNIGFLVVVEKAAIAGVLSERDCVRHVIVANKPLETTPVADIMIRDVVTVDLDRTFLRLSEAYASTSDSAPAGGRQSEAGRRHLDSRLVERGGQAS